MINGKVELGTVIFGAMIFGLIAGIVITMCFETGPVNRDVIFRCGDAQSTISASSEMRNDGMLIKCPPHTHIVGDAVDVREVVRSGMSRVVCECDK